MRVSDGSSCSERSIAVTVIRLFIFVVFFEAIAHFSFCGALSGCTGGRTDEILPVPEEVFYLRRQRGLSDGIRNNSPFSAVLRCV